MNTLLVSVAQLALSEGGLQVFGKRRSNKMIKFLLIVYFHGTKNYQSIFLFLNSVSNIYYTILYYTILYYTILYYTIYIYISILYTINIVGCLYVYIYIIYIYIYNIYMYIYILYAPHPNISHEEVQKQSVNIQKLVLISRYQATVCAILQALF